jgi:hypothetical protein
MRAELCVDTGRGEDPTQDFSRTLVTWFIGNGIGARGIVGTCGLHSPGKLLPYFGLSRRVYLSEKHKYIATYILYHRRFACIASILKVRELN